MRSMVGVMMRMMMVMMRVMRRSRKTGIGKENHRDRNCKYPDHDSKLDL
jgi:hypothetical protein